MPGPVFLRGERVDLHTVESDDVAFLQRLVNDPDVRETLGSVRPYNERKQAEWFESLDPDDFAFVVCADGDPVEYAELVEHFPAWGVAEARGSRRVLERNGFREEGRMSEHALHRGERIDVVTYGLLAEEWREGRGTAEG